MESPRKFNDCYFYYYSTCTKGDNCVFRHEPSALGCETMCTAWQQGKCLDKRCKLRHMELRKNRKQIPCYWENQPGGCRKIHCPFMHKNPEARTDGIAPSQPGPVPAQSAMPMNESVVQPEPQMNAVPPQPPVPAPVPLLWQQQRQEHMPPVVLDSSMLGVLPAPSELRRMLTPHHPHEPPPNPYAPLPVDPLVVNFEEESDNESAPSSTPTKNGSPDEAQTIARTKSQELLALEKIQAEAAAFYSYDCLPPPDTKDRKIIRTNLSTKYERLSLDELAGKHKDEERRSSLDFKVLSLDEIRAKKKTDVTLSTPPITLNLCNRKRKLSTQESVTTSGEKIIKVVRSKSIVYKQLDRQPSSSNHPRVERKLSESEMCRKRTISEHSDVLEVQEDELVDNCFEFKRIKIAEQFNRNKPRLIRNRNISENKDNYDVVKQADESITDNDSDNEVQIVSVEISDNGVDIDLDKIYDSDVIDVDSTRIGEPIHVVDLSDDVEDNDIIASDIDLTKNVPDVVASCHRNKFNSSEHSVLKDIDAFLNSDDDL